jgi:hypothetical protein
MLHSFYRMPAILYIAGVPTQVTLRWYKAPDGAKQLPFPSAIFSHVWDNNPGESQPGEIGEVGFPRTWDPGENHGYQGQCYRGDPSWFATGQLPALPVAPSPCLCQILPAQAAGGLVLTGAATGFAALTSCVQCPGGAPANWTMTVAGATGLFANVNGTWTVPYLSGCTWTLTLATNNLRSVTFAGGLWQIRIQSHPGSPVMVWNPTTSFACEAPNLYWTVSGTQPVGAPTSVQITPGP